MNVLEWALRLAGAGQLVLVAASPAIPRVLRWKEELGVLPLLLRRMFWVYAIYICFTHLCFGLVSVLAPGWLLDGSGLAAGVCGFAGMWWGVRLGLHVKGFETKGLADDGWKRWAKHGLGLLFLGLTVVYVWALVWNLTGGAS